MKSRKKNRKFWVFFRSLFFILRKTLIKKETKDKTISIIKENGTIWGVKYKRGYFVKV